MFTFIPGEETYKDPWHIPGSTRLQMLTAKRRRIAYFYEAPNTSSFRYRALNMTECLAVDRATDVSAGWFDHKDLLNGGRFIDLADAVLICRTRYNAAVATLVARAKARGLVVLFDCDDLVFDSQNVHTIVDSLALDQSNEAVWDQWHALVGRTGATVRLCDGFVATNEYLAARARDFMPSFRTAVVPNFLNRAQQELSETLHRAKQESNWARDERVHVGYFSGSPSHARDFKVAAPAIARLMKRDRRVTLRIVGFLELGEEFSDLTGQIEAFPLQDFMNLQRLIAEVEINIAPLQDNVFTNSKSELKFFEAAICGTPTVATPTFTFRATIRDGDNGFLALAHEWDDALGRAVALVDDIEAYKDLADGVAEEAKAVYGWDQHAASIERAVFESPYSGGPV
jgi:glycosyltransferase involved in cell wall biosynthesis